MSSNNRSWVENNVQSGDDSVWDLAFSLLPDRFTRKVNKTDDCWVWVAGKALGYGYYWHEGKITPAHRAAYELLVGPISVGLQIDHLCRNRACVNPNHLETVTPAENVRRGASGEYEKVRTQCWRGHEFSKENTYITSKGSRQCRECVRLNKMIREGRLHEQSA